MLLAAILTTAYLLVLHDDALFVQALATPARSRNKQNAKRNNKSSGSGGGFGKAKVAAAVDPSVAQNNDADDAMAKRAVSNLFSVCSHIQNPQLYQPKWADACTQSTNKVIATKDVDKGHVLTLFPIHALGPGRPSPRGKPTPGDPRCRGLV